MGGAGESCRGRGGSVSGSQAGLFSVTTSPVGSWRVTCSESPFLRSPLIAVLKMGCQEARLEAGNVAKPHGSPPPLSHLLHPASVSSIRLEALLQFRHFPLRAARSQRTPGPLLGYPESPMETAFRTLPRRRGVATFGLCQNRPRVLNPSATSPTPTV